MGEALGAARRVWPVGMIDRLMAASVADPSVLHCLEAPDLWHLLPSLEDFNRKCSSMTQHQYTERLIKIFAPIMQLYVLRPNAVKTEIFNNAKT